MVDSEVRLFANMIGSTSFPAGVCETNDIPQPSLQAAYGSGGDDYQISVSTREGGFYGNFPTPLYNATALLGQDGANVAGFGGLRELAAYIMACHEAMKSSIVGGSVTATYDVTLPTEGSPATFLRQLNPYGNSTLAETFPCGGDSWSHCGTGTGPILNSAEELVVTFLDGGSASTGGLSIVGGSSLSNGTITTYGYINSLYGTVSPTTTNASCFPGPDTDRSVSNYSGSVDDATVIIPAGTVTVHVSYCFWIQADPLPAAPEGGEVCRVICPADLNGDGAVTSDDLLLFLAYFEEGSRGADINGDGGVGADDLTLFLARFELGC